MASDKRAFVERAQRFPLSFPIRYLKSDISEWQEGKTINISRTGILFNAGEMLPLDSELKIKVQFPESATLSCHGLIVRHQKSAVAVRIDRCTYTRSTSS
jgi:hypothetical protein